MEISMDSICGSKLVSKKQLQELLLQEKLGLQETLSLGQPSSNYCRGDNARPSLGERLAEPLLLVAVGHRERTSIRIGPGDTHVDREKVPCAIVPTTLEWGHVRWARWDGA